jgi:hypothetical protein
MFVIGVLLSIYRVDFYKTFILTEFCFAQNTKLTIGGGKSSENKVKQKSFLKKKSKRTKI